MPYQGKSKRVYNRCRQSAVYPASRERASPMFQLHCRRLLHVPAFSKANKPVIPASAAAARLFEQVRRERHPQARYQKSGWQFCRP